MMIDWNSQHFEIATFSWSMDRFSKTIPHLKVHQNII
jgi:hypothetical protein